MIALLFTWIVFGTVAYTFGYAGIQIWEKVVKTNKLYSILDTILIGTPLLTSLIAVFSLWLPADTMLLIAIVFIALLFWFVKYKDIPQIINNLLDRIANLSKLQLLCFAVTIIALGMFCTLYPRMTDTLYYHYQALIWNEKYAVIPGLANLQPRFGFNSNLFLLNSVFGFKHLFNQFIFSIHTFFLIAIFLWTLSKTFSSKSILKTITALGMLFTLFVGYKTHITSITTDFYPNLLTLYLILKIILEKDSIKNNAFLFIILPLYIVTLKLSLVAIALITLYIAIKGIQNKRYRVTFSSLFIGLIVFVPWCARTFMLSGYLFFPIPMFDFFDVDWKVPMHYLIEQRDFIRSFAHVPNELDINMVLKMPITEWLPIWLESDMQYYNPILNRILMITTLISIPIGAYLVIEGFKKKNIEREIILIWGISIIAIIIWFLNAPDFRFIYSFIIAQSFISIYLFIKKCTNLESKFSEKQVLKISSILTIISIIFVSVYSFRWVYYQRGEGNSLLDIVKQPTSIEYIRTKRQINFYPFDVNGITVYRMSLADRDVLCYDSELPCSADYVGGLEMRGKNIEDGFRCNPDAPYRLTY